MPEESVDNVCRRCGAWHGGQLYGTSFLPANNALRSLIRTSFIALSPSSLNAARDVCPALGRLHASVALLKVAKKRVILATI